MSDGTTKFPWSSNRFGNLDADGCYNYTAKVVVTDGVAKMYVGYYTDANDESSFTYVYCQQFNLATINSNFNVNDELKIKLCVREVNGTSPKIVLSNWAFTNKEN